MPRIGRLALALPLLVATIATSVAADTSAQAQVEQTVWRLEQSIHAGRSGRMAPSVSASRASLGLAVPQGGAK